MNTPVFRLNRSVVSRVVWHDLFAELDLEIDQVRASTTALLLPAALFGFTNQ